MIHMGKTETQGDKKKKKKKKKIQEYTHVSQDRLGPRCPLKLYPHRTQMAGDLCKGPDLELHISL